VQVSSTSRRIALWLIPGLLAALLVGVQLWFADRLPDPMAVHWGTSSNPDGSMDQWWTLGVIGGMFLVGWLALLVIERRLGLLSPMLALVYFMMSLLAVVNTISVERNLDAAVWSDADPFYWWYIPFVLGIGFVFGYLGWVLGGGKEGMPVRRVPGEVTSAGLAPGGKGVWVKTVVAPFLLWMAAVPLAFLPLIATKYWWAPVTATVVIALMAAAVVTVSEKGLSVGLGPWGWPRLRVPLEKVERAEVIDVRPLAYGGWGLRWVPGTVGVILRSGPGIRVVKPSGREFVVTVDDPEQGAGLLNDLAGVKSG
jgi:hypothetical protein